MSTHRNRECSGFSLVELLVVIGIVALLMAATAIGIATFINYMNKVQAQTAMKNMDSGFTAMKHYYEYVDAPIGTWTNGRIQAGTNQFSAPGTDFAADGISAGDELFILSSKGAFSRKVSVVAGAVLTVDGPVFASSEKDLVYYLRTSGGELYPRICPARELDPKRKAWATVFTPHLNHKKGRYYSGKTSDIRGEWYCDPWEKPYRYELIVRKGFIVERLVSNGPDRKADTKDDLEWVISEQPYHE